MHAPLCSSRVSALALYACGSGAASVVDATRSARAKRVGAKVQAWTVDDRTAMQRLLDLGVHRITNAPVTLEDLRP